MVEPSAAPAPPHDRVGHHPYTGDIEIRVHGVSGTPPEELLGRSDVHQVAGDRLSGFYRPSLAAQMRDEPSPAAQMRDEPEPDQPSDSGANAGLAAGRRSRRGPWLEGYSWGGWTSGARSRVLWLVLLPFALVNVASRMMPPEPPGGLAARRLRLLAAALIRVLALSLTVTMVQGAAGVSMVTIALRCGTVPGRPGACHGLPAAVTDLLGRLPTDARVLLCAAVPLAVTALLWLVSRHASARYENAPERPPAGRPDDVALPLLRADLWQSGPVVSRLRLLHVQAGVLTVTGTAAWLLPAGAARTATLWLTAAGLAAASALVARRPAPSYTADRRGRIVRVARLVWIPVGAAAAGLAWQAVAVRGGPWQQASGVPRPVADLAVRRADVLVQDLFVGQGVLLLAIGVVLLAARLAGAGRGRALFVAGFGGLVTAMLAWLTAAMLTASVLVLVPAWLARPGFAYTPRQIATALTDPGTAGWFGNTTRSSGVGTGVGVAVLVLLALQLAIRALLAARSGGARQDRRAVRRDYPEQPAAGDRARHDRSRSIAVVFWWARRVDGVPGGMAVLCAAVVVLLAVQGAALRSFPEAPAGWAAAVLGRTPATCRAAPDTGLCSHVGLVAWGVFVTAGLAVLVLLAGVLAYRTRAARRSVGVFWDLACFWPRDTHPLAPPCYNERIMPQVSARVAWYLGTEDRAGAADPDGAPGGDDAGGVPGGEDRSRRARRSRGRLVLAGHSQGSVIALAAALIQPAAARRRLSLITVGCVLDRLYSRFFPRYFGPEIYCLASEMLAGPGGERGAPGSAAPAAGTPGRWINIWRHSDYLGGAVPYPPPAGGSASGAVRTGAVAGPINVRSIDPGFAPPPGDTIEPAAHRHSDFWTDPAFLPVVHELLDRTPTGAGRELVTPDAGL